MVLIYVRFCYFVYYEVFINLILFIFILCLNKRERDEMGVVEELLLGCYVGNFGLGLVLICVEINFGLGWFDLCCWMNESKRNKGNES